jgi:hypothetical protein
MRTDSADGFSLDLYNHPIMKTNHRLTNKFDRILCVAQGLSRTILTLKLITYYPLKRLKYATISIPLTVITDDTRESNNVVFTDLNFNAIFLAGRMTYL